MRDIERRLERLEQAAPRANPAQPEPPNVGELAARMAARWAALDAGTFIGSDYHARSRRTMREALTTMEV